jgi:chemotaxis methyl-accepting protein methylase
MSSTPRDTPLPVSASPAPSHAAEAGLPESAADVCLSAEEIGDERLRLGAPSCAGRSTAAKLLAQLRASYGVDFALYKRSTIERRIRRRMTLRGLVQLDDYVSLLESDANELASLYRDVLIGVTTFFRDSEPFEALKSLVFPRILEGRSVDVPIRIWVAGCSTGEEAYSVAIALLEVLGDRANRHKIQIFATDIDDDALARARAGIYPRAIDLDVSPERLERFFVRDGNGWRVGGLVRDLVVFARNNLGKDPPLSRIDLVTCRNVLIYMQGALQKKVLRILHYALKPDGHMLLGTSESVRDAADLFSPSHRKSNLYVKRDIPRTAFDVGFPARPTNDESELAAADRRAMRSTVRPRVVDLARKECLKSTIKEPGAVHEELESANEELQSAHEELETSKEELRSINEELATMNDELHIRIAQLSTARDDLHNVLVHVTASVVLFGGDLRIRRFSAAAERLLHLVPADVGRPFGYLHNVISARDIDQVAVDAMATVSPRELRVRCIDGSSYIMKMIPYVTGEQMIRGLVVEFVKAAVPPA